MIVWTFKTAKYRVTLDLSPSDLNTLTSGQRRRIEAGRVAVFDATVSVRRHTGALVSRECLYDCEYATDDVPDFWKSHYKSDYTNRNCSLMRAERGDNVVIMHYFPDMVRMACREARRQNMKMGFPVRANVIPY